MDLVLQQLRELLRRGKLELCQQLEVWFLGTEGDYTGGKKNSAGFWDRDAAEDIGPLLRRPLGDLRVL